MCQKTVLFKKWTYIWSLDIFISSKLITYQNDSYDSTEENSFYKLYFCGEDLGTFKDDLDAFNTLVFVHVLFKNIKAEI